MAKLYLVRGILRPLLVIIFIIIAFCLINNISRIYSEPENIYLALSRKQNDNLNCDVPEEFIHLPKILELEPSGDHNIFFVESWQSCDSMVHLTPRSSCAIESAARQNPNWTVYVFFIDAIGYENTTTPLIEQLHTFKNVRTVGVPLENLARGTAMDQWVSQQHYKKSIYRVAHVSDIARLLILFHYAGTYLDLDMISMKSLDHLGTNYALSVSEWGVANGMLNFGSDNFGRSLAANVVKVLLKNWDPTDWIAQGPTLMTQVFRNLCGTNKTSEMVPERCSGFKTLPKEEALAIVYRSLDQRRYFFEEKYLEEALQLSKDSTLIHFANSVSSKMDAAPKSLNNFQNYLGKYKCPSTFSVIEKWL